MKFRFGLPGFLICVLLFNQSAVAQLVADNAFLQGQWLEACIAPNGAWGNTVVVPPGYHTRGSSTCSYKDPLTGIIVDTILKSPDNNGLDFSFDQGHDGWTVGTPPWYGSFFLPGTPFDGWSVQIDDSMASAFYSNVGSGHPAFDTTEYSPGTYFKGTVTSYSGPSCWSPKAPMAGTWKGTYGLRRAGFQTAMQIVQLSEVDTFASWLNVTTKFYNTTDSVLKGVYYMATADPDNDVTVGGSYPTNNHIQYQGGPLDRHEVFARPPSAHQDAFTGLATQDCRARALIYNGWPPVMTTSNNLDKVWGGTYSAAMCPCYYGLDTSTLSEDIAYGLVFKIGDIAPHDSAFIAYAWIFSDTNAVDSLFNVVPQLSTEGVLHSVGTADSVFGCNLVGCKDTGKVFAADIINGDNRKWGLSKWTWTPAIGLSSTLGVHVMVDIGALSGPTTYTITGTPDLTRGSCNQPAPVMFTLYVQPCFSATSNIPCLNDTLFLIGSGDSAGATFTWTGPGGYTGTGESTYRFPLTMSDTGIYRLIRTIGTNSDTTYAHVAKIKPIPVVTASITPVCSQNTMTLTATPDSVGETFAWTGPNGFVSGLQNPNILNVSMSDTGLYRVITTWNGCVDTGFAFAKIDSTPAKPVMSSNSPICSQGGTLFLNSSDATPGITSYSWSGPPAFTSSLQNPVLSGLSTASSGVYTVTATIVYTKPSLTCSHFNTMTVVVDSTPITAVLTSNSPVCSGNALNLTATSSADADYKWVGPNSFSTTVQNPTINPATTNATGVYTVTATSVYITIVPAYTLTCTSDPLATIAVVVDSTPVAPLASSNSPGFPGVSICEGDTLKLFSSDLTAGVSYIWTGPNFFLSTLQNPEIVNVPPAAMGIYTVTAELVYTSPDLTCTADATTKVSINPRPPLTATSNSPVCTGDSLFLQAQSDPGAVYTWSGPYTFSTSLQNPSRIPAILEYGGVYQVVALVRGCLSLPVNDTVDIRQTPPAPWVKWLTYCQYYNAFPLQAYGDSILWYTSTRPPLMGTLTAPVPSTANLGTHLYFATQTIRGCTSAIDSIQVTVYPNPVLKAISSINLCPHDSAVINVTSSSDPIAYYHWSPAIYLSDTASGTIVTRPINDVDYTVVATNEFGCSDTAHIAVSVHAGAVLQLPTSVTIYPGESYQMNPETNCSYFNWFPPQGLDNAYISNPVASPLVNTKYIVTGSTNNGCKVVDSIDVIVDPQSIIALPNAFSPGNGPNNEFKIIKRGIATLTSFNIFDRWGVKVFSTSDIDAGWDGTYNGTPQPFGVYVYEISGKTSSGQDFVKKGNVTLLR